jgi:hypothetical protein
MIELIAEASGPTITILGVLGSIAFIMGQPEYGVSLLIFAGVLIVVALLSIWVLKRRGEW